MNLIKPLMTEKAVKLIESENKLTFLVQRKSRKEDIRKEFEELFKVKVSSINISISNNQKIAFIKLKKETPAINIATKLGVM